VRKKIEREVDKVWAENEAPAEERGLIIRSLKHYTFKDGDLDLPQMITQGHDQAQNAMRERYENLYDAEMKVASDKEIVDNLRQANIFLRQKECIKAFERYDVVLQRISDSLAATKGRILSINCAFMKDDKGAMAFFKKGETLQRVRQINRAAEAPKEVTPAPQLPERAPAQSANPAPTAAPAAKNKSKRR
jgi:hypothetical protein